MNYYSLLVALIILTALFMRGDQKGNKKYVIVACLLLFTIYGLRDAYRIGCDTTSSYIGNFERMQASSWSGIIESTGGTNALFYLMTKAFSAYISTDYQLYITVIAVFVTFCFGRLVYRYSPNPLQSILYYFGLLLYSFHFSALKQSIAMSFLFLAFDPLVKRKPIRFILLVCVAAQFHFPSLVFLPAYWLAKLRLGRSYLLFLAIMLALTYIFRNQIINYMNSLYEESTGEIDLSGVRFLRNKAIIMIAIVAAAVCIRRPAQDEPVYGILMQFMGLAIVFQTFCGYDNIFERLADYYFQFAVIFIPLVFEKGHERSGLLGEGATRAINTVAPFVFCGFGVYRFLDYVSNSQFFMPFYFFFQ